FPHSSHFLILLVAHHLALLSFPTRRSSDLRRSCRPGRACRRAPFWPARPFPGPPAARPSCPRRGSPAPPARWACRRQSPHGSTSDRKSTRLNSSHVKISYAVFCLKKKKLDI